jgi:hypothetical protein
VLRTENYRLPERGLELEYKGKDESVILSISERKCGQVTEKGSEFCMCTWHTNCVVIQSVSATLLIPNVTSVYSFNSVLIYILTIDCTKILFNILLPSLGVLSGYFLRTFPC